MIVPSHTWTSDLRMVLICLSPHAGWTCIRHVDSLIDLVAGLRCAHDCFHVSARSAIVAFPRAGSIHEPSRVFTAFCLPRLELQSWCESPALYVICRRGCGIGRARRSLLRSRIF